MYYTKRGIKGTREGKKGAREGKKDRAPFHVYFSLAGTLLDKTIVSSYTCSSGWIKFVL